MAQTRAMVIQFMDGSRASFDFPHQGAEPQTITRKIEELLKGGYLMIEADGALLLYPLANVRSIQIATPGGVLPANCVRGASVQD